MSFAWVFNLDAEFELAAKTYSTPARLREQLAEHGAGSRALMGPDDVLVGPNAKADLGRAWCPTDRAVARMRAAGITPEPHPSQAVLRRVNHRLFAHEVGGGLPGQAWVRTRVDLEAMIHSGKWMLKRPLAFAGRGQLRVNKSLSELDEAWISASLREDGLIVEPLVVPARELSIHGFLRSDGRFEIGRACEQAVSARGVFRGMSLAQECPSELHDKAEHVAHALKEAGYFGPFGIDSYMHADGFCALSEINARYTMGFALGFPRPSHMLTAQ